MIFVVQGLTDKVRNQAESCLDEKPSSRESVRVGADKLLLVVMISSLPKNRASIENTDFSATVFLIQFGSISGESQR